MKKVLVPLWASSGRDFQMVMPVVYYLEKVKHYNVKIISVWDWYVVDKFKPDLVLFSATEGATNNLNFAKYLKSKGYPIVSLTSEGNYRESVIEIMLWGNKDKILYEDKKFLWSQRCLNMVLKYYPELKQKIAVSGAVGFDRYRVYSFMSKKEFLEKYNKSKYHKVIGYACWGFDLVRTEEEIKNITDRIMRNEIEKFKSRYGENFSNYLVAKSNISNLLKETIKNNPDILFILKLHPGTLDDDNTEIKGLDFENVLVLKYEEEIADIINSCDIWTVFDSTTTFEAWLLNKSTIHLFPPAFNKDASTDFKGSVIATDCKTLQNYIDEYYTSSKIKDFEDKKSARKKIVEQIIQWDDGLNHVRVGEEIVKMIERKEPKILKDSIPTRIKLFGIHLMKKYSKYLKNMGVLNKINFVFYQVSDEDIQKFKKDYYPCLDNFHGGRS